MLVQYAGRHAADVALGLRAAVTAGGLTPDGGLRPDERLRVVGIDPGARSAASATMACAHRAAHDPPGAARELADVRCSVLGQLGFGHPHGPLWRYTFVSRRSKPSLA